MVGLTREAAETRLTRARPGGLDVEQRESDQPEDEVIAQSPGPGARLDAGRHSVTITVSEGASRSRCPT